MLLLYYFSPTKSIYRVDREFRSTGNSYWRQGGHSRKARLWGNLIAPRLNWKQLQFNHIKNDYKDFMEETMQGGLVASLKKKKNYHFTRPRRYQKLIQLPSNPPSSPQARYILSQQGERTIFRQMKYISNKPTLRNLHFKPGGMYSSFQKPSVFLVVWTHNYLS